jgi:hypothetical protein
VLCEGGLVPYCFSSGVGLRLYQLCSHGAVLDWLCLMLASSCVFFMQLLSPQSVSLPTDFMTP